MKSSPYRFLLTYGLLLVLISILSPHTPLMAQSTQADETLTTKLSPLEQDQNQESTTTQATEQKELGSGDLTFAGSLLGISLFIIICLFYFGWFNREHWSGLPDRGKFYRYYDAPILIGILVASTIFAVLMKHAPPVYIGVPEGKPPGPEHNVYQSAIVFLQLGLMVFVSVRLVVLMFSTWTGIERQDRPLFAYTADEYGFGLGASPNSTFMHSLLGTPACIVLAMATGSILAITLFLMGIEPPAVAHETLKQLKANPRMIMNVIILAVIIAPVYEEIVFRLFLQGSLSKLGLRSRPWVVILIASILFAVMHAASADLVALLPLFVLGVCFGAVYERTGSIVPPILMHMGFNGSQVALVWYQIQNS